MGNSFTCISHKEEQRPTKSSAGRGKGRGSNTRKYMRRLSLSCSGSSSTSSSKKGVIKPKKKIRERHHQDHDKNSHIIQEQTLAATNLLFNQTPRNSNYVAPPGFRRSTSSSGGSGPVSAVQSPKKSTCGFVRTSSSRRKSSVNPVIKPNQLPDKASLLLNRKLMNICLFLGTSVCLLRLHRKFS